MYCNSIPFRSFVQIAFSAFLLFSNPLKSQNTQGDKPGIYYREREHDFGELQESMKFATHRFEFINRTPKTCYCKQGRIELWLYSTQLE